MRLKVFRTQDICTFELLWGQGQELSVEIPYPSDLTHHYQTWRTAYLDYYSHWKQTPPPPNPDLPPSPLRARVQSSGSLAATPKDYRKQLVEAEAALLRCFRNWLSHADLLPLRSTIARAETQPHSPTIDLFLTCKPAELEYLPWEAWEIPIELGSSKTLRIARTPANLRDQTIPRSARDQARVLAILGDDTGLNFQAELAALQALSVTTIAGSTRESLADLKARIIAAISDPQGWDILFFAGHSDETSFTGGELAIAPGISVLVQELKPALQQAKHNGLQLAIFNSCRGLSIANALIEVGLSQVVIMREPIHNQVAQLFLIEFVKQLAQYQDSHTALLLACQALAQANDRTLDYPSAHLIPSFFRHPQAPLLQLQPSSRWHAIARVLPSRKQAAVWAAIAGLSLVVPIQDLLMDGRWMVQALYRQVTHQIPQTLPPTVLVQIDEASIRDRGLDARKINPIDRRYLAEVLEKVQTLNPRVIGIDFLLDRRTSPPEDARLIQAIQAQPVSLVFASDTKDGQTRAPLPEFAKPHLQGQVDLFPWYLSLPAAPNCRDRCPFAYTLARTAVARTADRAKTDRLTQTHLWPIATWAESVGQPWFHPLLDFSIPPKQVYRPISAQQLFKQIPSDLQPAPIVLIAAGGYDEAGVNGHGEDNFTLPSAIAYWNRQQNRPVSVFTGAEAHAYMVHHLWYQRWVIPIPDWLGVLLAGSIAHLWSLRRRQTRFPLKPLLLITGLSGMIGLQLFISIGILLPWGLPTLLLWLYPLPKKTLLKQTSP